MRQLSLALDEPQHVEYRASAIQIIQNILELQPHVGVYLSSSSIVVCTCGRTVVGRRWCGLRGEHKDDEAG